MNISKSILLAAVREDYQEGYITIEEYHDFMEDFESNEIDKRIDMVWEERSR